MSLSGKAECCWVVNAPKTRYSRYEGSGGADVAIVGAGIVGLSAAYLLAQAGLSVAVLEARRIGGQVTGRSSAKITSQHSLIYRHLIDTRGLDVAKRYAEANRAGERQIRDWIRNLGIACDFEIKDAYTYTTDRNRRADIEMEAEAARQAGFDATVVAPAPLPFPTAAALRFPHQAQFNPAQYLVGLAVAAETAGARIFEDSPVNAVEDDKLWRVKTGDGVLDVRHVVLATNYPIIGTKRYDGRARPRYHICMAFRVEPGKAIDGMFISIDEPTHSLRMGRDADGPLLIALGGKIYTGQEGDMAERFSELERWVRDHLEVGETAYRWGNEDYDTADRVAFVGQAPQAREGCYVATGFNGWGISNGTAAAMLIADRIRGRSTPWASLFDPARNTSSDFNPGGDTQSRVRSLNDIAPGQGGVIKRGDDAFAVHRDDRGTLRVLSASCSHLGCTVTWNNAERTWDCPCHGSIFAVDGTVIHGPATEPLAPAAPDDVGAERHKTTQSS